IGSSEYGEGFTLDDDLPNSTIYGETCAAIGLVFFARRMLRLEARGEYADTMERALYNGVISGMQLDGKRFFYVNPLEVDPAACEEDYNLRHVKPQRQTWFGCACCPPNIIRLLSSLENYVSDFTGETLFVHLYVGGEIKEERMTLRVETRYPWEGNVKFTVCAAEGAERTLALRIPGWCRGWRLAVNGTEVSQRPVNGYVYLKRQWQAGDQIDLNLDMPAFPVRAHPRVKADAGKAALQRGPLVYCLEEADNGKRLHELRHKWPFASTEKWEPDLLGGIVSVTSEGLRDRESDWGSGLYGETAVGQDSAALRWIPYYAWANRDPGEMCVWVRT
ncbi:MAG: glycoside hydrolase family 127 protein, partial [Clostridia bacterium]|nr:glycoside hydrolase family 127 protein [Clostridia bacterium]